MIYLKAHASWLTVHLVLAVLIFLPTVFIISFFYQNLMKNKNAHLFVNFNFLVNGKVFPSAHKEVKLNRNIDIYSVNAAAHAGKFNVRLTGDTEQLIKTNNITMRPGSPAFSHFLFFQTKPATRNISRDALVAVETTQELGKRL